MGKNRVKDPGEAAESAGGTGGLLRFSRIAYAALAWIFVACVVCQVFLAGMAVFVDPLNWLRHVSFVHLFGELPVLMLLFAFAGRMPKGDGYYLGPVILFTLIAIAYATADAGRSVVGALHPVNALVIAGFSFRLAQKVGRFTISALEARS